MKFSENPTYGFAIGRVRAKETYLIKRSEYEKIAGSANPSEFLSSVNTVWRIESGEKESASFENTLQSTSKENIAFFTKYCIDPSVKKLLLNNTVIKNKSLTRYLEKLANEFLSAYFKALIDLENIRSFIRIKNLAQKEKQDIANQKKLFNQAFLSNGTVNQSTLSNLLAENWEALIHWSTNTPYQVCVGQGVNYLVSNESFLRLERLIQEHLQKILLQARYTTFGYEPLVAYYLFKDTEIRNLRRIYYGILEKTPLDQIKESIACVL